MSNMDQCIVSYTDMSMLHTYGVGIVSMVTLLRRLILPRIIAYAVRVQQCDNKGES